MVVRTVRCCCCSSSSSPVQTWERVRAELEIAQVEERRGDVSSTMPRAGAEARTRSRTWPGYRNMSMAEKHLNSNCSLWVCHFFLNNLNKLSFSGTWGWVQVWTSWCCLVCWWCWCYRHWSDHPAGHVQMYPHSGCCHLSDPPRCPAPGCWTAEVPSSAEEGGGPVALCRPSLLARRPLLLHPLHLPPHRLCLPLLLLKERMTCLLLLGGGGSSQYYERSWESMKCVGLKESLLPLESVPCPPLDRWGFHSGSKDTSQSRWKWTKEVKSHAAARQILL